MQLCQRFSEFGPTPCTFTSCCGSSDIVHDHPEQIAPEVVDIRLDICATEGGQAIFNPQHYIAYPNVVDARTPLKFAQVTLAGMIPTIISQPPASTATWIGNLQQRSFLPRCCHENRHHFFKPGPEANAEPRMKVVEDRTLNSKPTLGARFYLQRNRGNLDCSSDAFRLPVNRQVASFDF